LAGRHLSAERVARAAWSAVSLDADASLLDERASTFGRDEIHPAGADHAGALVDAAPADDAAAALIASGDQAVQVRGRDIAHINRRPDEIHRAASREVEVLRFSEHASGLESDRLFAGPDRITVRHIVPPMVSR
jgi:hypothetical protein